MRNEVPAAQYKLLLLLLLALLANPPHKTVSLVSSVVLAKALQYVMCCSRSSWFFLFANTGNYYTRFPVLAYKAQASSIMVLPTYG